MEDINPELESFREQWRREVTARSSRDRAPTRLVTAEVTFSPAAPKVATKRTLEPPCAPTSASGRKDDDGVEDVIPKTYHDLEHKDSAFRLGSGSTSESLLSGARRGSSNTDGTPHSALEHYEKAVEKESQGSLGESLSLYRKAYRVCPSVTDTKNYYPPSMEVYVLCPDGRQRR